MKKLNKKDKIKLITKGLIITTTIGMGIGIINQQNIISAYAIDSGSTISNNKEWVKAKILNDLLAYKQDIVFTSGEYTTYIGTDVDPKQAYFEVLAENPEIFWTSQVALGAKYSDNSYTLYINNLYSDADINTKKAELTSAINSMLNNFSSYNELRKVYEIHDYVNANVIYDHDVAGQTGPTSSIDPNTNFSGYIADIRQKTKDNATFFEAHSLYGAVIKGTAVCEGYAKFANVLLSKSGVEAKIVLSNSHAWNYVKVNGNYYQLDTTWDDQSDNKTLSPYKYFNITSAEMLKDESSNVTLHTATSYVPNCTDTTFDNIFRTVNSNIIQGKNIMRINDKLYLIDDSTNDIYSCNLDGSGQATIRTTDSKDLLLHNLMTYNGDLYYLSYRTDATYTYLMEINKIDLLTNTSTPVVNLNDGFNIAKGNMPNISFYIDSNKFKVKCDGVSKEFSLTSIASIMTTGITISGGNSISVQGGTTQLAVAVAPSNTTDKTVIWSSSDNTIATIDSNGVVTAKTDGNVTITATANDGSGIKNTYNVSVTGQTIAPTVVNVTGITISGTNTISVKDGTTQLSTTVTPTNATDKTVTWTSSDTTIATVDSNGLVSAKTDGSVVITATANDGSGIKNIYNVSVTGQTVAPTVVNITGITISGTNNISVKDGTTQLAVVVAPSNATDKTVTWSSSDNAIAIVDSSGLVTAKTDGNVVITATANDGSGIKNTYNVSVTGQTTTTPITNVNVTGINISGTNSISVKDGTTQLAVTVAPNNATDKTVTWTSSDNAIAIVDSSGLVTAKTDGNVVITATANDGSGIKNTYNVSVTGQTTTVPVTNVNITGLNISGTNSISVKDGTTQLAVAVAPSNATDKTVTWSSSDNAIVIVDSSTGLVTAKANGNVVITATANDGSGIKNTYNVSVTGQTVAPSNVNVTNVTIGGTNSISAKGGITQLSANVAPSNATDKTVTWSSSNNNIATVDANGLVTAKADGNVTITATANDGSGTKNSYTITISGQTTTNTTTIPVTNVKITEIIITGENSITTKGDSLSLTCKVSPSNATDKKITWTSSDNTIATVNSDGLVTAKTDGTVVIKAKANDGSNIESTKTINISGQSSTVNTPTNSVTDNISIDSVSISGTEEVGNTLKCKVKYTGTKPNLTYQWQKASSKNSDYKDINGADEERYKLKSNDKNKYIKVIVTATINGIVETKEDITSKIDKDSSINDEVKNTITETSNESNSNNYSSNNNINVATSTPDNAQVINTGKNQEIYPTPDSKNFLNPSGSPFNGWINQGNTLYYFENGNIKTGWLNSNSNWYYFNGRGVMQTGWMKDYNTGKWYFLNDNGSMAYDTYISGYYLGSNGAWIN